MQQSVQPRVRGFICTTAHPTGCAANVQHQIDYVKSHASVTDGPKRVLIIGASTGYGLASRISAAFGCQAATIGVFYERPASGNRTASAGWYNTVALEKAATQEGLYAKSINGDAFSNEIKQQTIDLIKADWDGGIDLVIYSLASPRRIHPDTGEIYNSVLKTIGKPFTDKNIDVFTGQTGEITIEPASQEEINQTVAVMGGEDWGMWLDQLKAAGLLSNGVVTLAYDYVGPAITFPIYHQGTIGQAKADVRKMAKTLAKTLSDINGHAYISVNKAVVTQASSAIPVVPLYISLLFKVMKQQNRHEGCIEQIWRLFSDNLYNGSNIPVDEDGLIRMDDWEMTEDVQAQVANLWQKVNTENINSISDLAGYRHDFYALFGFDNDAIDYQTEVETEQNIPSIKL